MSFRKILAISGGIGAALGSAANIGFYVATGDVIKPWPGFETGKHAETTSILFTSKAQAADLRGLLPALGPKKEELSAEQMERLAQMEAQYAAWTEWLESHTPEKDGAPPQSAGNDRTPPNVDALFIKYLGKAEEHPKTPKERCAYNLKATWVQILDANGGNQRATSTDPQLKAAADRASDCFKLYDSAENDRSETADNGYRGPAPSP